MKPPEFASRSEMAGFGMAARFGTALWSGLAWRGLAAITAGGLIILAGGTGTGGWTGASGPIAPVAFVSSAPASQPGAGASAPASQPAETAPAAPAGATAAAGNGQVTLSWVAPSPAGGSGATRYNVYESATAAFSGAKLAATVRGLDFTVASLTNGTRYYFWLTASDGVGESSPSSTVSATPAPPVTAPGAPTGLQAIGGEDHVTLSWSAPASTGGSPVTGYRIYVGSTSAFRGGLPRMTSAGTSATVDDLPDGTTYYFRVTAVNAHGAGVMSPLASATTGAPNRPVTSGPPTGLSARPDGSRVILSWSAPAGYPQPSGYLIYEGTRPGGESGTPISKILVRSTGCVVAGLTGGARYYFKVTAVDAAGSQSLRSAEVSAVPVAGTGINQGPGTGTRPSTAVERGPGQAPSTQATEVAQAPAPAGRPIGLIILLAAVAVAALAGAVAAAIHLRRIRRYPDPLGSPPPHAPQAVGPNGPDHSPQELLSTHPNHQ
jgi:Fibronectin type III domain